MNGSEEEKKIVRINIRHFDVSLNEFAHNKSYGVFFFSSLEMSSFCINLRMHFDVSLIKKISRTRLYCQRR